MTWRPTDRPHERGPAGHRHSQHLPVDDEPTLRDALDAMAADYVPDVTRIRNRLAIARAEEAASNRLRSRRRLLVGLSAGVVTTAAVSAAAVAATWPEGVVQIDPGVPSMVTSSPADPTGVIGSGTRTSQPEPSSPATDPSATSTDSSPGTTSTAPSTAAATDTWVVTEAMPSTLALDGTYRDWVVLGARSDNQLIRLEADPAVLQDPQVGGTPQRSTSPLTLSWTDGMPEEDRDGVTTWLTTSAGSGTLGVRLRPDSSAPVEVVLYAGGSEPGTTVRVTVEGVGQQEAVLPTVADGSAGLARVLLSGELLDKPVNIELVAAEGTVSLAAITVR